MQSTLARWLTSRRRTATFANVSGFADGINGIMVDLSAVGSWNINASDFTFTVGLNNSPSKWAAAPTPSTVSVRTGAELEARIASS